MKEFQQRRFFRKIFLSRPVFVLFLAIFAIFALSVFRMYEKSRYASLRNEAAENSLDELKNRSDNLRAAVGMLDTEEGIEKELRDKFQIKKPGEEYVVILENNQVVPEGEEQPKEDFGFFKRFVDFFKIF